MNIVTVKDKQFSLSIEAAKIQDSINKVAERMNKDLADKDPLFVVVLNGSFMFASDLFKKLTIPCEITFVKLSSYEGTQSTEVIKTVLGLNENIEGRTIVIVEDIVDTGNTIEDMIQGLKAMNPSEILISTLLFKPKAYKKSIKIDYVGIEIPNDFIVGFGLDYDGYGRNLADIYKIVE
jgi:hypoxanthine phosphoribosyltransferase